MAGEWESAPLSELCEQIADCPHSTPLWTDSGVIVIRNHNIRDGRLDLSSPSYSDEAHFEQRSRRARLKAGGLVLTREAPISEVCMVPEKLRCCLDQRMVMLRSDQKKCDSRFLLYSIKSDAVQHEIKVNEGTGSTVSNLRIPLLEALPIPHPALAEQKAIAAVLGALDDTIELNRRMNATLEAMARALNSASPTAPPKIFPEKTTIISARGTVGKLALTAVSMAMNQSCYGDYFTYYSLRKATAQLQQRTHGTVFDTITTETFKTLDCIFPTPKITATFDKLVEPLLGQIRANLHQSRTLATLRDTLLPKLLSGELSVANCSSGRRASN